jgi:Monoamine oxidase
MKSNQEVVIVGGGLSGLALAYFLSQKSVKPTILEAAPRLGGRIQTIKGILETPLELGATWFSDMHPNLLRLIDELGLKIYPQYSKGISLFQTRSFEPPQRFHIPEAESPSYRLAGGTQSLIDALSQKLPTENIHLNAKVRAIEVEGNQVAIETNDDRKINADKVVIAVPPQLAAKQITFSPKLPDTAAAIFTDVQTWMAGAIKFTLEYAEPFWRNDGYSGMLYSHAGIITEMYDHTNFEGNKFGLTGFLNSSAASYPQEVRKKHVLQQLGELMGVPALKPTVYSDKVWTDEFIMEGNQPVQRPHQYNGHPLMRENYMEGKLAFSASETANEFGGYMEGAVIAAKHVLNHQF